jgi:hypothetical protein
MSFLSLYLLQPILRDFLCWLVLTLIDYHRNPLLCVHLSNYIGPTILEHWNEMSRSCSISFYLIVLVNNQPTLITLSTTYVGLIYLQDLSSSTFQTGWQNIIKQLYLSSSDNCITRKKNIKF